MACLGQLVIIALAVLGRPGETQLLYPTLDLASALRSIPTTLDPAQPPSKATAVPVLPLLPTTSSVLPLASSQASPNESAQTRLKQSTPARPTSAKQSSGPRLFDTVWAKVRRGVNTECKACPDPLCTNKNWFGSAHHFRASCYATGATVNNTKKDGREVIGESMLMTIDNGSEASLDAS